MRKVIFSINITMDGCCDHTKVNGSAEIHEYFAELLRHADVLVYGRITYPLMVPFWPDLARSHSETQSVNDFADAFDAVENIVVFSRTLEKAEYKKTRIVRGDLVGEIARLKQETGKDILLGGVDLPSQLLASGLIDEYRIVVHPIVAGEGRRLFADAPLQEKLQLRLVDTEVLGSGCVVLRYVKQGTI